MVYYADEDILDLLKQAYTLFFSENGLNPTAFPSLRKFETEVVAMTARLLGGGDETVVGNMTAGGTDSILAAVKTARDWAAVHRPQAQQARDHPAANRTPCFRQGRPLLRPVRCPHGPSIRGYRADPAAVAAAVNANTILIVGSAPSYPHGVVDPIPALAEIARSNGVLCHVDACVGGFVLPFAEKLGYPVPPFDFRVPASPRCRPTCTSTVMRRKGASVVLYEGPSCASSSSSSRPAGRAASTPPLRSPARDPAARSRQPGRS